MQWGFRIEREREHNCAGDSISTGASRVGQVLLHHRLPVIFLGDANARLGSEITALGGHHPEDESRGGKTFQR